VLLKNLLSNRTPSKSEMTRFAICVLLLQVALPLASEDTECLLQVGMHVDQKRNISAPSPCACIPWTEAYSEARTLCGNGYEYFSNFHGKPFLNVGLGADLLEGVWKTYCVGFYSRLKGNTCMNRNLDAADNSGQWCYVSKECNDLNGGEIGKAYHLGSKIPAIGGGLNAKICTKDDPSLRDWSPAYLALIAMQYSVNLNLLCRASYPRSIHHWADVSEAWGIPGNGPLSHDLSEEMNKIKLSRVPHLFDATTGSGHSTDLKIVSGSAVWAIVPEDSSPSTSYRVECLAGCLEDPTIHDNLIKGAL